MPKRPHITHLLGVLILMSLLATSWAQDDDDTIFDRDDKKEDDQAKKVGLGRTAYVQASERFDLQDNYKPLTLNAAIEQGIRSNFDEIDRKHAKGILELDWDDTKEDFWLPKLNITLASAPQRIARLRRGGKGNNNGTGLIPAGSLGLNIGEYTIYNWGKDYIEYLNSRADYLRESENLKEERRNLKHDLITKFFELEKYHEIERIRKDQLRHSSFIYRFNREKVTLRKVTKQEYYQSRMEYLKAQSDYHEAKNNSQKVDEEMSYLLADPPGTRYILNQELNYQKVKITLDEAMRLGQLSNVGILDAKKEVNNAKRSYELVLKENLPLPKFTVGLGAYTHAFGQTAHNTRYNSAVATNAATGVQTGNNNSDIDVVATVNATWTLTGTGGLFNGRKTTRELVKKHRAFNTLAQAKHLTDSDIKVLYRCILSLENQITILEARTANMQKTFDIILENYLNKKARYIDLHDALQEMTDSEIKFIEARYDHVKNKIALAKEMGVEDFPGGNFETLAQEKKEKR